MKRFILFMLLLVLALTAAQCSSTTPAPPAEKAGEKTVVIGFTTSRTGDSSSASTNQTLGLELWLETVKDGIKLSDGTVVKFEFRSYNDASQLDRVQQFYTKLINEDKTDFLISPYSSNLAEAAAFIAEEHEQVMIVTGAASDTTYQKGFKHAFQIYTPASRYLTGAVDMLSELDPTAKKVAFLYEKDKFAVTAVQAAEAYAEGKGYEVVLSEGYNSDTIDFTPFLNKIVRAEPDIILGGGHLSDSTIFARQLRQTETSVKAIVLLVAPPSPTFARVLGDDLAVNIMGPSQWEPQVSFTKGGTKELGADWIGPGGSDFVNAFKAAHGGAPSYHAAGGYAAGLVLQKAIIDANSVDPEKVKAALEKMDIFTFFGRIKFSPAEETYGLQTAHDLIYMQWQKDETGKLVKEIIWPKEAQSAEPVYPLP